MNVEWIVGDGFLFLHRSCCIFLLTHSLSLSPIFLKGHGIFYTFPVEPVAVSYGKGFFQSNEASRTAILGFSNNVVHSCAKVRMDSCECVCVRVWCFFFPSAIHLNYSLSDILQNGLYFDKKYGERSNIENVNNDYDPREDPLNSTSARVSTEFRGFTGNLIQKCSNDLSNASFFITGIHFLFFWASFNKNVVWFIGRPLVSTVAI